MAAPRRGRIASLAQAHLAGPLVCHPSPRHHRRSVLMAEAPEAPFRYAIADGRFGCIARSWLLIHAPLAAKPAIGDGRNTVALD